jgi:hypothetical protein
MYLYVICSFCLKSSIFWVVTQREVVYIDVSGLRIGPKTLASNHPMLWNNSDGGRLQFKCSGKLMSLFLVCSLNGSNMFIRAYFPEIDF